MPEEDTTIEEELEVIVEPFVIEADHPRNADLLIQSIPNLRLRSAIRAQRTVTDVVSGEQMVPEDQNRGLSGYPSTPGMRLHVDPANLTYLIEDPLYENSEMTDKIKAWLRRKGRAIAGDIRGVKPQKGTIDVHRMKTLCRELLNLHKIQHIKPIKSPLPSFDEVEALPGKFLLNPGARVANQQPVYEEDWDNWLSELTRSGG